MTPGPGLHRTILPLGFFASGVNCGVRRYRPDLGLTIQRKIVLPLVYLRSMNVKQHLYCIRKHFFLQIKFVPLSPIQDKPMPQLAPKGLETICKWLNA